ncbi:SDR family oxidoreductase [Pseudarthrobacter sp. fls2-241-R2A-168]|uniref:SDR family oxidoreductase n=1 Tax=Pseudarthrobacter sp. fls2-241-R2A-168 TaxID=3040304 RepID=UPI00255774AF|nr:SDR family oxidoreductase [Pseudarthrobacter sp. fls2-241-R2A-168]
MTLKVLITAGAGGIGRAITRAYIEKGAAVHVVDISAAAVESLKFEFPEVTASIANISQAEDVARVFDDVRSVLGGLDVLINNAGIAGSTEPAEQYGVDVWESVMAVNLTGTFRITREAIPLLRASDSASIIVMSALAGRFGYPNRIAYSTSKWGLIGFTKTLSMELGPHGINVNAILPGAVAGPRFDAVVAGRAALSGKSVEEELDAALGLQSLKQLVHPADIAALALFLTGPHGKAISGQILPMDGDSKSTV